MKQHSLMRQSLTRFALCVAALLLLAAPLFYLLTKNYYAEDMADLIEAVRQGHPVPHNDLETDIMQGLMLQFALVTTVLGIAVVITVRFITQRLWQPFEQTLTAIEGFSLESGTRPELPRCRTREFDRLNATLNRLTANSLKSYRLQKEFTENASHELQTPLAIFQSKLDLLLQQPELTEAQAAIIQDLYQMNARLSRLSRNLLWLAKIENNQFRRTEPIDLGAVLDQLRPALESMAGDLKLHFTLPPSGVPLTANRALLESLVNNLMVNAIRHNRPDGSITIAADRESLTVTNTSTEEALDPATLFSRFHHTGTNQAGNGLGLAIVKAVCDYHGWTITYHYDAEAGTHSFCIRF